VDVVEKASWWGLGLFIILAIAAAVIFSDAGPKLPELPVESAAPVTTESLPKAPAINESFPAAGTAPAPVAPNPAPGTGQEKPVTN
jgi:hypothetical protein